MTTNPNDVSNCHTFDHENRCTRCGIPTSSRASEDICPVQETNPLSEHALRKARQWNATIGDPSTSEHAEARVFAERAREEQQPPGAVGVEIPVLPDEDYRKVMELASHHDEEAKMKSNIKITVSGGAKTGTTTVMRLIAQKLRSCGIEVEENHVEPYPGEVIDGDWVSLKIRPSSEGVESLAENTKVILIEEKPGE